MKISRISIYRKDLNYVGGKYAWGRGNVIEVGKSTIVMLETDNGITGVGEFCPCGDNYMDAHSEGTESTAQLLAPKLLGEDPRQLTRIVRLMDSTVRGTDMRNHLLMRLVGTYSAKQPASQSGC